MANNARAITKSTFLIVVLVLALISPHGLRAQGAYTVVVAKVKPRVALIESSNGFGTGFFTSESCVLATAAHVVGRSPSVKVHSNSPTYEGTVIGWDKERDIALIQGRPPCAWLEIADSDRLQQGEEILVIGYPALLGANEREPSVTRGIISATQGRNGLIQHDAATFGGTSGSPVVNLRAEVVGVHVTGLRGSTGFAFAAPSNWLKSLLAAPRIVRSSPVFDNQIVPGDRISGVAIGMTSSEVSAAGATIFGRAASISDNCTDQKDRERGFSCLVRAWQRTGDTWFVTWVYLIGPPGQETVTMIGTRHLDFQTKGGLGNAMTLADFIKVYGEPRLGRGIQGGRIFIEVPSSRMSAAYWPSEGIGYSLDTNCPAAASQKWWFSNRTRSAPHTGSHRFLE